MEEKSLLDIDSISANRNVKARKYWENRLKNVSIDTYFNTGNRYEKAATYAELEIKFSESLYNKLNHLTKAKQAQHLVLLGALGVLANKYSFSEDILIFTSKVKSEIENNNKNVILPIRISDISNISFKILLNKLRENFIEDIRYEKHPAVKTLVNENALSDKTSTIGFLLETAHSMDEWESLSPDILFSFNFLEEPNFKIRYNERLYNEIDVQLIGNHYTNLLEALLTNLDDPTAIISMLGETATTELATLFKGKDVVYRKEETVLQLFAEHVKNTPNKDALFYGDTKLTFKQLDIESNKLANYLQGNYKVTSSDLIGILMDRSNYFIVSILAVLKTGAAYVPMDPESPSDRISMILSDAGMKLLISEKSYSNVLETFSTPTLIIDVDLEGIEKSDAAINNILKPSNLAYVIYTSGTTGKPKGVMIDHAALYNYISWGSEYYVDEKPSNFGLFTSIAFDLTMTSIFTPLATGNSIVIFGKDDPYKLLEKVLTDQRIQIIKLTPSHLSIIEGIIKKEESYSVHKFIVGGERFDTDLAISISNIFNNKVRLYNEYGPTEATIGCMIYEYKGGQNTTLSVPIGKPIANTLLYILDAHLNFTPKGVEGELYISGKGLSLGYFGNDELTKQRFIDNPFEKGTKIYKTGDIVRYLSDGNIEYVGRNDDQVKINGYRIELKEIEIQLDALENIDQSIVVAKEISHGNTCLVGYIVGDKELSIETIKTSLSSKLPQYMIPDFYMMIDVIPLTSNAKIDYQALPEPKIYIEEDHQLPSSEIETVLLSIWAEILKIDKKEISVTKDFFEMGVNSISAFRIVLKIKKELSVVTRVGKIFEHKTIRDLAIYLESCMEEREESIPKIVQKDLNSSSSAQERMFYNYLINKDNLTYNIASGILIEGEINIEELRAILNKIVHRHPSLRTLFVSTMEGVFQKTIKNASVDFDFYESSEINMNQAFEKFVRPHDLENDLPIRFGLFNMNDFKKIFFIDVHHIACDGYSLRILVNDLRKLLEGKELPIIPITYADYSYWQRNKKNNLEKQQQYWSTKLSGELTPIELSTNYGEDVDLSDAEAEILVIDGVDYENIKEFIKEKGITDFMFLIAAYYLLLHKITGNTNIIIGSDVIGRTHSDLKDVVGTFVNILPLRLDILPNSSCSDFVKSVKQCVLDAFDNQDFQFDEMVKMVNPDNRTGIPPLAQVHFAFDSYEDIDKAFEAGNLKFTPVDLINEETTQYEFKLDTISYEDQYAISFIYSKDLYHKETIQIFMNYYRNIVKNMLLNDQLKIEEIGF